MGLLAWGLGQGSPGTLVALAGAFALDRVAGPPGGFWTWTAVLAWAILLVDRRAGRPSLLLRFGVVVAVAALLGRLILGTMGIPGGLTPALLAAGALWMVERR